MLEKYIQRQILDYLKIKGVYCWRQNTGAVKLDYKGRQRYVRFGKKGMSDILGIYNRKLLAIEVKGTRNGERGMPSKAQKDFIAEINARGGIAFVARSIEDVDKHLFKKYGSN